MHFCFVIMGAGASATSAADTIKAASDEELKSYFAGLSSEQQEKISAVVAADGGRVQEQEPEKAPEQEVEKVPEQAVEKAPEQAAEKAPEQTGKSPEQDPEKAPEKEPEKAPEQDTPSKKGSIVVIAGPPAAGKGTQCDKIKDKFGYVHISTGDILRENVKNGTELGLKAKPIMEQGGLVPSDLIVDIVKDRLAQPDVQTQGCLLDGFPRAPDQAKAMADAGVQVDAFVLIVVPDDSLVERGVGRRLDPETGVIYHLTFKPPPEEVKERLVHRSDDHEEQIRTRLATYHSQKDGIIPFFQDKLTEVDGTQKPDEVFAVICSALEKL